MTVELILGDCIDAMKAMPDNSIDAVVTDPPYELGFMGKSWDNTGIAYQVGMWAEVLRILKPGGHLLSFGGSRTYHRMACAIEDAGFEIRDQLQWIYGQGFPKSLDISKAIDKMAGAEREVVGKHSCPAGRSNSFVQERTNAEAGIFSGSTKYPNGVPLTTPATPEAQYWQGWGTALKPSHECICLARKPISEGTVAKNVLAYGTGGINIDGCRVGTTGGETHAGGWQDLMVGGKVANGGVSKDLTPRGRFPANILHDGSDEVVGMFPASKARTGKIGSGGNGTSIFGTDGKITVRYDDTETNAARFFYSAKASRSERNAGLEGMEKRESHKNSGGEYWGSPESIDKRIKETGTGRILMQNHHPTVKPIAVMRWLVRLITPPNGTVLDPFTGSGTTGIAAVLEGFDFIGIEREAEYHEIARRRVEHWQSQFQMRLPIDANC